MSVPRDWNAISYDAVARPVQALGHTLLDRLELQGGETVLDAGCGSGAVTAALVDRVPRGRVIAVDGAPTMVAEARARLGDRADVRLADLSGLELETPVDVVFSSATFHWVPDHETLFRRLHAVLKPGGRLLAQYGGDGNIAEVRAAITRAAAEPPFAASLAGWPGPWTFDAPGVATAALERAGFTDVTAGLHTVTVTSDRPHEYLETVILGGHLQRLPDGLRAPFVAAVAAGLPEPLVVDYVRITVSARRPA
jgi:trans-aconitate 2-methyltransferase